MSCGAGRRRSSDLALLWLWRRLAAKALIQSLAWERPCATGGALKIKNKQTKTKHKLSGFQSLHLLQSTHPTFPHSRCVAWGTWKEEAVWRRRQSLRWPSCFWRTNTSRRWNVAASHLVVWRASCHFAALAGSLCPYVHQYGGPCIYGAPQIFLGTVLPRSAPSYNLLFLHTEPQNY